MLEKPHSDEREVSLESPLETTRTADIDNYHGLTLKIILVYSACFLLSIAQIITLVGSGAFARTIATTFSGSVEAVWLAQIPVILICSLGPPLSQAADYWGRKWFLVIPTACGFAGCMIVAKGSSWAMVIAGQVINSLSVAPSAILYAVASEILPRKFRGAAQSGLSIGNGVGAIFTLIFGEWLVNHSPDGWRTFFFINGGIQGLAALVFAILYNPPLRTSQVSLTQMEKLRKLDWVGSTLLISGIVLYSLGLSWSQNPYSWKNAHVLATFIAGVILLIFFAAYETLGRRDGMFHHDLFKKDRNFVISLAAVFAEGFAFYAVNGYFVFESSVLWETNPVLLGTRFSITFITANFSSAAAAIYVAKTKTLRGIIVLGFVFSTLFNILMATASLSSGNAAWAYAFILGLSFGILLVCLVVAAQLSAPPRMIAVATGLLIGTRSLGASSGLPIFNAIFDAGLAKHLVPGIAAAVLPLGLSPKLLPEFLAALLSNDPKALAAVPGISPQIIGAGVGALKEGYKLGFRYIWVCAGVVTFIAGILSCFIVNPKKDLNMHVDAPLDGA